MLKWHYRSRLKSLFRLNKEFYNNELLVYPSPSHDDPELGLKLHYNPNTVYDRGSSSANHLEARDVVKEIFNHFDKYGDTKMFRCRNIFSCSKKQFLKNWKLNVKSVLNWSHYSQKIRMNVSLLKTLKQYRGMKGMLS